MLTNAMQPTSISCQMNYTKQLDQVTIFAQSWLFIILLKVLLELINYLTLKNLTCHLFFSLTLTLFVDKMFIGYQSTRLAIIQLKINKVTEYLSYVWYYKQMFCPHSWHFLPSRSCSIGLTLQGFLCHFTYCILSTEACKQYTYIEIGRNFLHMFFKTNDPASSYEI